MTDEAEDERRRRCTWRRTSGGSKRVTRGLGKLEKTLRMLTVLSGGSRVVGVELVKVHLASKCGFDN